MAEDKLAAILAGMQERAEQLTATHADEDCPDPHDSCTGHDALRLIAAVEAALKHHKPGQQSIPICACGLSYPCYEVRDIMAARLGEGE